MGGPFCHQHLENPPDDVHQWGEDLSGYQQFTGVYKYWTSAAIVTNTDVAMVTLQRSVPVQQAWEWQIDTNGNAADVDLQYTGAPLTVPVGAGQSVYVLFSEAGFSPRSVTVLRESR